MFIAILGFFNKPDEYSKAKAAAEKKYGKSILVVFDAFFCVYLRQFILVIIAVSLGVAFALIAIYVSPPGIDPPPTPTPHKTITPPSTTTITPTGLETTNLDDLIPLRMDKGAFFFHEWDEFNPIKINSNEYDQSIGVKIPQQKQDYYYDYFNNQRMAHETFIEYSLSENYQSLNFDYGIDDSSFPKDRSCAPQCHYWIVVYRCSAEKDVFEKADELFRTKEWNYYKTLQNSGNIDVSGVEAIRITIYWYFDVIQTKPLAFNIAIVNPTLSIA